MTARQDAEAAAGPTVRIMRQADILRCRHVIMLPSHYREDGTCKCDDPAERRRLIREAGYHRTDFDGIPLRKDRPREDRHYSK
jgi:hypothetical protein